MAGSFADYLELYILDRLFGTNGSPAVLVQHIALFTAAPSDTGGGTEVTNANAYARLEIEAATGRVWTAAAAGAISNSADWSFAAASGGNWGTVVAMAILDSGTHGAGNYLVWADLTVSKAVNDGDTAKFASGDLDITLD